MASTTRCPRNALPVAAGHVGGGAGLVEKHKADRIQKALPHAPVSSLVHHIGPVLLGGSQALFCADPLA
jgi:hypothetical protein